MIPDKIKALLIKLYHWIQVNIKSYSPDELILNVKSLLCLLIIFEGSLRDSIGGHNSCARTFIPVSVRLNWRQEPSRGIRSAEGKQTSGALKHRKVTIYILKYLFVQNSLHVFDIVKTSSTLCRNIYYADVICRNI